MFKKLVIAVIVVFLFTASSCVKKDDKKLKDELKSLGVELKRVDPKKMKNSTYLEQLREKDKLKKKK